MHKKLRHIALFFGLVLNLTGFAQKQWDGMLPKLEPTSDFSVWTALNYNFSRMTYEAGSPIEYMSNSRMSQTLGLDYMSYTLSYTFRLPFNTLDRNSPLSSYYKFSTGYGAENWEISAYIGRTQGWFDVTDTNEIEVSMLELDSRYRGDLRVFTAGLTGFYFLSSKYRYSHAMKFAYLQNKSGFTFYSSFRQKYMRVRADSSLYSNPAEVIPNSMNALNRLFTFEAGITFGFTGLWTNEHWFLRGLIGFGPGIQFQSFNEGAKSRVRPFVSPALDAKLSVGYKTNGFYLALNFPIDMIMTALPNESMLLLIDSNFSFTVGFQMHDLIREANKRNLLDEPESF